MYRVNAVTCIALLLALIATTAGCGGGGTTSTGPELTREVLDAEPGAVERLAKALSASGVPTVKKQALTRLGNLGAKASAAVPAVEKCAAEDADEEVRQLATETLAKIKG